MLHFWWEVEIYLSLDFVLAEMMVSRNGVSRNEVENPLKEPIGGWIIVRLVGVLRSHGCIVDWWELEKFLVYWCGWQFLWNFWWTPSHKYWLAYVTICLSFLPRLREGHLSIGLLVWFVSQSSRGTQIIPPQLHLLKVGTSSFGKKRKHMTYDSCFSFFTGGFVICVLLTKSLRFAWTWWWIPVRGDFCWEGTICLSFLICLTLN